MGDLASHKLGGGAWLEQRHVWISGQGGYHTYRIPALAITRRGTLLAFCEGRKHGRGDAGEIDLLLRRSSDGGASWGPVQVVVTQPGMTCGNPCPTVDYVTGAVWLPLTKNLAEGGEELVIQGQAPRTVWLTHSWDDGITWAEPVEITAKVARPEWTWYATGPTHGIQLPSGRLVAPCDHVVGVRHDRSDAKHSHVIISDDHGATWRIGGIVGVGTNECAVAELADGRIYINCRNYVGTGRRAWAYSVDGGDSFGARSWDATLVEPICQGSVVGLPDSQRAGVWPLLFSNPASTRRERMGIRLSQDNGRSWSSPRVLHDGPAAYSDLAVLPDGSVGCLYECGSEHPYERLIFARFNLAWALQDTA